MAKDYDADTVMWRVFWITTVGMVLFGLAVSIFILPS